MIKKRKTAATKKSTTAKKSDTAKDSKKTPAKKTKVVKKKTPAKKTPAKKTPTKKTSAPKKTSPKVKKITVDVISDEVDFLPEKPIEPDFSSWSKYSKTVVVNNSFDDNENNEEESNIVETDDMFEDEIPATEEYDKQKKFFSEWAEQIKPEKEDDLTNIAPSKKSLSLYRRLAFSFIVSVLILAVAISYFFFSKLTVIIIPQGEPLNDSITFNISNSDATEASSTITYAKNLTGDIKELTVSAEKIYNSSGEEILGEEVIGEVVLFNKYNKSQPLVATTRLLTSDGKLFRLKNAVNIPAGGQVTAEVYADKPSPEMAIQNETHFTIPGLWVGLQDQIYAENSEPFVYQSKIKKYVMQRDLDQAANDIVATLALKIKDEVSAPDIDKILVYGDASIEADKKFEAKLGEAKDEFKVSASKKVVIVTFSKKEASQIAENRLSLLVPDDKKMISFDKNNINFNLENFDLNKGLATVKAYFSGSMTLKEDSSFLEKKRLANLNDKQISEYLNSFPEIKDYDLKFFPSFVSKAPALPDKIEIKINEME